MPEALPKPQPLQAEEEVRTLESARHRARAADADVTDEEEGEAKQAGGSGIANFLGLKLPELPSFPSFFGSKKPSEKSDLAKPEPSGQAIPVPLGVKPESIDLNENVS